MSRSIDRPTEAQALRAAFLAPVMRSAQWHLSAGAETLPWVRRTVQALLLGSGAMAWVWALAAVTDVWPVILALVWSWHLVRMWRAWARPAPALLLCWRAAPEAAWHVPAWGDVAVQVRLVWDGQSMLLLHLRTTDALSAGRVPVRQAWRWVADDGGRDAHRLRTLLGVPSVTAESPVA